VGLWASKIGRLGALIECTTNRKVGPPIRRRRRWRETIGDSRLLQTTKPHTRLRTILDWDGSTRTHLYPIFCLRSLHLFPHPAGAPAAACQGGHDLWLVGFTRLHVTCIVTRSNIMLHGNGDVLYSYFSFSPRCFRTSSMLLFADDIFLRVSEVLRSRQASALHPDLRSNLSRVHFS
jgi:hypothetical protein